MGKPEFLDSSDLVASCLHTDYDYWFHPNMEAIEPFTMQEKVLAAMRSYTEKLQSDKEKHYPQLPYWQSIEDPLHEGVIFRLPPEGEMERNILVRHDDEREDTGYKFEAVISVGGSRKRRSRTMFRRHVNMGTPQDVLEDYIRTSYVCLEQATPACFEEEVIFKSANK